MPQRKWLSGFFLKRLAYARLEVYMLSTCCLAMLITFRWDGDELEDERLDMAGGI